MVQCEGQRKNPGKVFDKVDELGRENKKKEEKEKNSFFASSSQVDIRTRNKCILVLFKRSPQPKNCVYLFTLI